MTEQYNAGAIEVLNGLEPVRRRPGMYTDTARPNHLGQEVIDNSVDEALAGHASKVQVILHADQSLEVIDDGRGMPVDIHPEEKISGVELIFCKLHAGGKFSNKNYQFSGGLHGVGISVVNALSKRVEVAVRRDGQVYEMAFENGNKVQELTVTGTCGRRNRGTSVHFWPDASYFDSANFSVTRLVNNLRAKAVLCPGLEITFSDKVNGKDYKWYYEDGLKDYLAEGVKGYAVLPEAPFTGEFSAETEAATWAVIWQPEGGEMITESYVNLIPTAQGVPTSMVYVRGCSMRCVSFVSSVTCCLVALSLPVMMFLSVARMSCLLRCKIRSSRVKPKSASRRANAQRLSLVWLKMRSAYG